MCVVVAMPEYLYNRLAVPTTFENMDIIVPFRECSREPPPEHCVTKTSLPGGRTIGDEGDARGTLARIALVFHEGVVMFIDVLRPLLCTRKARWAERPPKVMKAKSKMKRPSDRWPRRDSNSSASDLLYNTLRIRPRRRPPPTKAWKGRLIMC